MEYFLVRLSYTPAAWQEIIDTTTSLDGRLEPVRKLLRHLGGSLASFGFFDTEHTGNAAAKHVVRDKFVMWNGHDLLTVLAMPDKASAQAFNMAISAEAGLKLVDMTPMVPMEDAVKSMAAAKDAVARTGYAAPGRARR